MLLMFLHVPSQHAPRATPDPEIPCYIWDKHRLSLCHGSVASCSHGISQRARLGPPHWKTLQGTEHIAPRSLLLLLGVIPSLAFWTASLVAMLSFCIPASADDLILDAAFKRLELHQEELLLLLFVRGSTF
jgi:hypothetical protein